MKRVNFSAFTSPTYNRFFSCHVIFLHSSIVVIFLPVKFALILHETFNPLYRIARLNGIHKCLLNLQFNLT